MESLEVDLNKLLDGWNTEFKLDINPPSTAEIIKSLIKPKWKDERYDTDFDDIANFGSGFQRHFIYSLIEVSSNYAPLPKAKKKKDFTPELSLLLFEEPEAYLHPPQQDNLARNLQKITTEQTRQVICSSHSTHFVSRKADDILGIIHTRATDDKSEYYQLTRKKWNDIIDSNQVINSIATKYPKIQKKLSENDFRPEMEAVKYFLWMNPDRAGLFFANHVILFEGPTEVALTRKLMDDHKLEFRNIGIQPLDCMGKYNIHRFMNLLKGLGIHHSVIHDDDNNINEHVEINQLIQDTADDIFTTGIGTIQGELEDLLEVTKAKADHRKPQHVLFLYSENEISEDKIDAFTKLIKDTMYSDTDQLFT